MLNFSIFGYALLASFFVGAVTLPLGFLFLKKNSFKTWLEKNFISLCAGVMVASALLDLMPEALEISQNPNLVAYSMLIGIAAFFVFERSTVWFHHHHSEHGISPTTKLVLIGDGIHNFVDGVAIAGAFLTSVHLGIITTFAIMLHEIPTEISDLSLLINKGMKVEKAIFFNFISALISIAGTTLGILWLSQNMYLQAPLLAITSGMFIYIACSDLIPDLHNERSHKDILNSIVIFTLGIVIVALSTLTKG